MRARVGYAFYRDEGVALGEGQGAASGCRRDGVPHLEERLADTLLGFPVPPRSAESKLSFHFAPGDARLQNTAGKSALTQILRLSVPRIVKFNNFLQFFS